MKTKTATPRTDAAIKASNGFWSFVLRDLAQELERELEQERQDRKQAELDVCRALGERNDARAELAAERKLADRLASALTDSAMWYAPPAYQAWKEARRE
jgi:hypothetical protein